MHKIKSPQRHNLWFERIMAITILVNFSLILFDLSYIPLRDFYVRRLPYITQIYDPIKGIEPHRETQNYLEKVDKLEELVSQLGLKSPQAQIQLQELTKLTAEIIDTNPFAGSGKSGALEVIKNRMRKHIQQTSAKHAFAIFWNQEYLLQHHWKEEINFFDQSIRPLIITNYYRKIAENGLSWDNFWVVDLPFVCLFGVELLGRAFYIKHQHPNLGILEAILWRWYDLFLLFPFWRSLRIIPLIVRLDQSQLVNLKLVQQQINQGILANFAQEITEIVVSQIINQIQNSIQRGDALLWLSEQPSIRPYIDINDVNEIEALIGLSVQTIIHQVMPKIQPEIIAILRHNISIICQQIPIYRNLQNFPGIGQAQAQLNEQLATQITTSLYNILSGVSSDPVTKKLTSQLGEKFIASLGAELQNKNVTREIENLLIDFLEEIKINYVQRLSQQDIDQIIAQTRQMKKSASVDTASHKNTALVKTSDMSNNRA